MNGCLEASQEVMSLSGREAQAQRPQFDPLEALDMGDVFGKGQRPTHAPQM